MGHDDRRDEALRPHPTPTGRRRHRPHTAVVRRVLGEPGPPHLHGHRRWGFGTHRPGGRDAGRGVRQHPSAGHPPLGESPSHARGDRSAHPLADTATAALRLGRRARRPLAAGLPHRPRPTPAATRGRRRDHQLHRRTGRRHLHPHLRPAGHDQDRWGYRSVDLPTFRSGFTPTPSPHKLAGYAWVNLWPPPRWNPDTAVDGVMWFGPAGATT